MKKTVPAVIGGAALAVALIISPARAWQTGGGEHDAHHPATQPVPGRTQATSDAKLDELVKKMNAAQGQAKVDAMAELLTALVHNHQQMHGSMANMMSMMEKMHGTPAK